MKKDKIIKGSLTIELTLLMPFILGVFVFIILSGFVLHDKCMVNKACMSAALRGSLESEDGKAMEQAGEAINEVLPESLLGKWSYDTQIDIGEDAVRVSFAGDTEMGISLARRILSTETTTHNFDCKSLRLKEAEYIRKNRKSGVGYCL